MPIAEGAPSSAAGTAQGVIENSNPANEGELVIAAKETYCGTPTSPKNFPLKIFTVTWFNGAAEWDQVTPSLKAALPPGQNPLTIGIEGGGGNFDIVCPSSAAAKSGLAINPAGVPLE